MTALCRGARIYISAKRGSARLGRTASPRTWRSPRKAHVHEQRRSTIPSSHRPSAFRRQRAGRVRCWNVGSVARPRGRQHEPGERQLDAGRGEAAPITFNVRYRPCAMSGAGSRTPVQLIVANGCCPVYCGPSASSLFGSLCRDIRLTTGGVWRSTYTRCKQRPRTTTPVLTSARRSLCRRAVIEPKCHVRQLLR